MASKFSLKVDLGGPAFSGACPEPFDFAQDKPRRRVEGLLLALWLLATLGCSLLSPSVAPFSRPATPTRRVRATLTPTPTQTKPTPIYPTPDPSLIDSDGDLFSDEVEVVMGNDPFVNECLQQIGCGGTEILTPSSIMNIVIVLDASAGMADETPGGTRTELAKAALSQYVESLPPGINVGLLFYGHRGSKDESDKAESCAAIDLVYRVGPVDRVTFKAMLASAPSVGWGAPVAESLLAAQQALAGREVQTNRILLVTSGGDNCGGDPCRVVQEMRQGGVATIIDVIGLNLDYAAIEPLQCVANTTGGLYYSAPTADGLVEVWEALQWREKHWFETESCLAPSIELYLSCRQDELSRFTEWADSAGWTQDHLDQFMTITQALAQEQTELATLPPSTPTPTPTPTP